MYKKKKTNEEPLKADQENVTEPTQETTVDTEAEVAPASELELLKAEVAQYKDNYLRTTADFQNFKRRTEKEKSDIYKYAGEKLLVEILPIVDNIDRAMAHVPQEEQGGLADGLRMIQKSLLNLLEQNGVEPITAVGEVFDPELHHAVQMVASEDHEPHCIIEEYQKGYKLNGKVIRHSMVKVAE